VGHARVACTTALLSGDVEEDTDLTRVLGAAFVPPSNTQADKAAEKLIERLAREPPGRHVSDEVWTLYLSVVGYTGLFKSVLEKALAELDWIVATRLSHGDCRITSRLKTVAAIGRKLNRSSWRLSQIQDIAGCRLVFTDERDLRAVQCGIQDRWPEAKVDDFTDGRRSTGYRAVHVVTMVDGRPVEIQLRTTAQHRWADAVEVFADRYELDGKRGYLKEGDAPDFVVRYFAIAASILDVQAKGGEPGEVLEKELSELRERVRQYVREYKRAGA
jgi:ppGpp synthetase/RelA/SpoT-type nucleotidyltranferase